MSEDTKLRRQKGADADLHSKKEASRKNEEPKTIEEKASFDDGFLKLKDLCTVLEKEKEELQKKKDALEADVTELRNDLARSRADFHNYKSRTERERTRDRKLAAEKSVELLIPVYDNLERTMDSIDFHDNPIYKGVSMVRRQFFGVLLELGLEKIPSEGAFNPEFHEAIGVVEVDDPEKDGQIIEELQRGFTLGGRVLRASKVRVGKKV